MADSSKSSTSSSSTKPIKSPKPKQTILHVRIDAALVGKIDHYAKSKGLTRSIVVRDVVKGWAKGK